MICGTLQIIWIWRALDCATNRTIGWFIGDCSAKTFERFYKGKLSRINAVFYIDDWEAYRKVLLEGSYIVGKKFTISIEQNNSDIRHFLSRFNRRTKVVSHSTEIIALYLRLCWHLNEYVGFEKIIKSIASIFT